MTSREKAEGLRMLDIFFERLRQKRRTVLFPAAVPTLPPRFRGRPFIDAALCDGLRTGACSLCRDVCPVEAIRLENGVPALDMGICTFCGTCARACPREALTFTTDWRLASTSRDALIIRPLDYVPGENSPVIQSLPERPERRFLLPELPVETTGVAAGSFKRSFRLRQVSAAGCGACEADLNVLATIVFDLARFGMDFVASPRHADGMALTGPVPRNMRESMIKCRNAMGNPKTLLAVGACAISGGLFRSGGEYASGQRSEGVLPHLSADLFIPGCPPHPYTSLDGLLRFLGQAVPSFK